MEIKSVWAVYFSGTGTTEKVVTTLAKDLAQSLNASYQTFCFNLPQSREGELAFGPQDLVVFGVPVYAGRVPNLLLPYIQNKVKGQNTPAVPVVLYGNRNFDDGLMELRNVLFQNGFRPFAAGAFVGEHSFSKILGAGRPDSEDIALAAQLAEKAAQLAKDMAQPPEQPAAVEGCDPIRPYYTPRDRHGDLCARICPMGSIDPNDVSNVVGKCIKCCACVKKCPVGAKYFDHPGYLYHQHELEDQYAGRRAPSKIFF